MPFDFNVHRPKGLCPWAFFIMAVTRECHLPRLSHPAPLKLRLTRSAGLHFLQQLAEPVEIFLIAVDAHLFDLLKLLFLFEHLAKNNFSPSLFFFKRRRNAELGLGEMFQDDPLYRDNFYKNALVWIIPAIRSAPRAGLNEMPD